MHLAIARCGHVAQFGQWIHSFKIQSEIENAGDFADDEKLLCIEGPLYNSLSIVHVSPFVFSVGCLSHDNMQRRTLFVALMCDGVLPCKLFFLNQIRECNLSQRRGF